MICPKCKGKSKVRSSRPQGQTTRRFRECLRCKHRYNTVEILEVMEAVKKPAPSLKGRPKKRVLTPRDEQVAAPKLLQKKKRRSAYSLASSTAFQTQQAFVVQEIDIDSLSDEALEQAIFEGRVNADM